MTRAELEEAVRAILLEQMGGPQVLSLDLPRSRLQMRTGWTLAIPGTECGPTTF